VVDGGKNRIILSVLVVPGEVNDNQPILDLIWRILFRWHIRSSQATGDMMYGTTEIIKALEDAHIRAYIPVAERGQRPGYYGAAQFTYDAVHDQFTCPASDKSCDLRTVWRDRRRCNIAQMLPPVTRVQGKQWHGMRRFRFFLNPYQDVRFSTCPQCANKTGQRKLPLFIHIDPK
jgi:hypothetical protein